ncbi:MAG: OmpH family outer membrane protein [Pseudarcicella sp.]|nr:OmpH family outer membrane protein [Pseudarcicella sp.]MBP6410284.1 OmpH family outer membrane protein [Pseudarcicella sp.]
MKIKNTIYVAGFLSLATVVMSCDKSADKKTENKPSATSSNAVGNKKIVFVNTDSLLTNYQFYKDAQKEFESKGYRLQVDLGQKERALQNEVQAIQQRAQQMSQAELQAADLTLKKKGADFQQYSQSKQAALAQEQAKKNEDLYNTIREYIKRTNKENQYEFVLGYSSAGGGILYADDAVDVTDKLLDGLNKEYADKKAKK